MIDISRVGESGFNLDEIDVDDEMFSGLDSASRTVRRAIVAFYIIILFFRWSCTEGPGPYQTSKNCSH